MKIKLFYRFLMIFCLLACLLALPSAKRMRNKCPKPLPLASVHIVDRNGFSETISHKDRLNQFQQMDFLKPMPYQKVLRLYARDYAGNIKAIVTSYHANGNPRQYLDVMNGRALGWYLEWHENGSLAVSTRVVGGMADINPTAERSWLFDGVSQAWDEEGRMRAEIPYSQGLLEGVSLYYYSNGQLAKRIPYNKGLADGVIELYRENGEIQQQLTYAQGVKHGPSTRMWSPCQLSNQEEFYNGRLESGQYFDKSGNIISEVKQGNGYRIVQMKDVCEHQEYRLGSLEGEVKVFDSQGRLKHVYHVKNEIRHGEETEYFPSENPIPQPKLSFNWVEGKIQGQVKTWYSNGVVESQREMANNKKSGVATSWYRDGNLMMIEEYDLDKLVRGDYFKKGEKIPVSQVIQGKGLVTIYDADGNFIQKIPYLNGKPDQLAKTSP